MFNIVNLKPGESIFQDAGIPHAYLMGQNMELMANSDNVLRGGLTPKYVDVPELMEHVKFESTFPEILGGELQSDCAETIYKTSAEDFELSKIDISAQNQYVGFSNSSEILFVQKGTVTLNIGDQHLVLRSGESCFIASSSEYTCESKEVTTIFKAKTP